MNITVQQACEISGLSTYTIRCECRRGSFEAYFPRGRKFGYAIDRRSFEIWMLLKKMKTGNAPARARARRQLAELGPD